MLYLINTDGNVSMYEFGTDDGKIIISPRTMTASGDMKVAALAMVKDVFKTKSFIRKYYYNITILNHNSKFTAHLNAKIAVEDYPSWWFEFKNHFDSICDKLGAFM